MSCTTFTCESCGPTQGSQPCCPTCQPAQPIYQGPCQDPGTQTTGRYLSVLDYKFCPGRLATGPGFLVSNINGSGNAGLTFTTTPQVQLTEYLATANQQFGNLVVMGSDYRWRYLQGPSTLGLFLQTDANGMLFFGNPPVATVPDPLAINDLSVANKATINDLTTNGTVVHNNLNPDTVVNLLGLNAGNELVLQAVSAGVAGCMFYESATSPNAGIAPNKSVLSGQYLTIGNRLFDSGANLISVTTSQALTVNVAGKYLLMWSAQVHGAKAGAWLEINNVIVNWANGRTDGQVNNGASGQLYGVNGIEMRSLAANDVLKIQLSTTAAANTAFEVRLIAIKFAD